MAWLASLHSSDHSLRYSERWRQFCDWLSTCRRTLTESACCRPAGKHAAPRPARRRLALAALRARADAWLASTPRRRLDDWCAAIERELAARPWPRALSACAPGCHFCRGGAGYAYVG